VGEVARTRTLLSRSRTVRFHDYTEVLYKRGHILVKQTHEQLVQYQVSQLAQIQCRFLFSRVSSACPCSSGLPRTRLRTVELLYRLCSELPRDYTYFNVQHITSLMVFRTDGSASLVSPTHGTVPSNVLPKAGTRPDPEHRD